MRVTIGEGCAYCGGRRVRLRKSDGSYIRCQPCRRQIGYCHLGRSEPWTPEFHDALKQRDPEDDG